MPTMPSPPAADTAAASRPPLTPAIGAETTGTVMPNCSVSQVVSTRASLHPGDSPHVIDFGVKGDLCPLFYADTITFAMSAFSWERSPSRLHALVTVAAWLLRVRRGGDPSRPQHQLRRTRP